MPVLKLLTSIRIRRRRHSPNSQTPDEASQKLTLLIQGLSILEKATAISGIPYLKGAVGVALEVAKCVERYHSNNEEFCRLAVKCGDLVVAITNQVRSVGGVSQNLEGLVKDFVATLKTVQKTVQDISQCTSRTRRFLAQEDYSRRLKMLSDTVNEAQLRFMVLASIANHSKGQPGTRDAIYDHNDITLDSQYSRGEGWIAFHGTLRNTMESVIVKRYQRGCKQAVVDADIRAFKEYWHSNLPQYLGRSSPLADAPHIVLKGVTSDHVSSYIASKFAEDNQRGSVEALRLLRDLTNALAFTVGTTASSSFDISKIHLNDSGNVVVVNLDPVLDASQASDDGMPYWRSWQEICIELLAGDPRYEPNPSIEYDADPTSHQRLEYLRPILGHIHYGGARFREASIVLAFNSQGLVLDQAYRDLQASIHCHPQSHSPSVNTQVLGAMWRRLHELHYVAHFREPLDVNIGDIGYITGNPPRFVRLKNMRSRVTDDWAPKSKKLRPLTLIPPKWWTTSTVDGIVRHECRFSYPLALEFNSENWHENRPRILKESRVRRVNVPSKTGLVVECTKAWKVLAECAADLAAEHHDRSVAASDLILVVYTKQQTGYAMFRLNKPVDDAKWKEIWAKDGESPPGSIYFYESPPGGPSGVWGYFSLSPSPGKPYLKWTPDRDDAGDAWGWTYQSEDWTIEISKPKFKQYIRYVQL
ncbi:hypothetical protein R3P38DRAFT_2847666 [Favolaschia claudopus]|uniref:Fungal N-terminal domain-containing protein n=1 Tax=Favolaschia claudopus TaxID=2862362 RepID=A0AAW0DUR0_9AGAR